MVEVLNAIYETDFVGFSYGFRPDGASTMRWTRSRLASRAGGELDTGRRYQGFFDNVSHEWMMRFVEHRWRSARAALDPQVAEGRCGGRRCAATGDEGHPARGGHLAAAGQHLPPLRLRSVGRAVAATPRGGAMIVVRYADDTVVGFENRSDAERFLAELRIRMAELAWSCTPRRPAWSNSADRPRPTGGTGGRQTGNVRLPGLYPHLHAHAPGRLPAFPTHTARSETGEVAGITEDLRRRWHQNVAEQGRVAGRSGPGLHCLSRRAHQHAGFVGVPASCHRTLAPRLAPAQPEGPGDLATWTSWRALAAQAQDIPSLAV